MCGFAGVVTWDDRYRVSPETLKRMSAAVAHRGPDGEGFHINHHEQATPERPQVALVFRRLAILDPDPRSDQPFTDGRHWLVFNGEIYNFRELRKEITSLRPHYQWKTTGDTEVLLAAYATWREQCVDRLNGMFAFAIWDSIDRVLFLARDRMGQKPLYIASDGDDNVIAFASEIAALRQLRWASQELSHSAAEEYLRWGYVPAVRTVFRGIFSCRPSERTVIHAEPCKPVRYFDRYIRKPVSDSSAVADTRRLVIQAVEGQLISDAPLGVFLSGGIDSSVIAACARRFGPVQTFSIGFEDPRYDERRHAEAIAQHLGTEHLSFLVTPDAVSDLPRLAQVFGEPFADSSSLPTHYLARETRKHVKVALSGDGGDELFGGYDRYRAMDLAERLQRLPAPATSILRAALSILPGTHPKSLGWRLKRFGAIAALPAPSRYSAIMRVFDEATISELTQRPVEQQDYLADLFDSKADDVAAAALALDRVTYLPDDLLTKVDRCSMLHALEVRSPFMDHELVQFASGLTTDQLLKGGPKRMLREAFKDDLPAWVFKRKKMGFAVPIGEWFRGQLRPMLRDTLFSAGSFARQRFNMKVVERLIEEHEQNKVDHAQRLYALLMLELWWNTTKT